MAQVEDTLIYKNMKCDFNFKPTTKVIDANGVEQVVPHLFDMIASDYLAEQLLAKVNTENPELDYRIANELKEKVNVELTEIEVDYLRSFINLLQVDNLYKGQLLDVLNETKN